MQATVVGFSGKGAVTLSKVPLAGPSAGEVLVRTERSAISAGTELLFFRGEVQPGCGVHGPAQATYPCATGYSAVGVVEALGSGVDPSWTGQRVFGFAPHQDLFLAPVKDLVRVPPEVPVERAAMLANVETAVSLVMDAAPVVGERALVVGQGVVGQLVAGLLSRLPLQELLLVDSDPQRLERAGVLCASPVQRAASIPALAAGGGFDLAIELTGQPTVVPPALDALRYEGRLIIGSWFGDRAASFPTSDRVHRNRNAILFSQVSQIDSRYAARFDKARRLSFAMELLREWPLEKLVTHRLPPTEAGHAFQLLADRRDGVLQVLFAYAQGSSSAGAR